MISVVCSSQYPLDEFKKHVIKTSGLHDKIEFLAYENKGEFSLTEIYNKGLKDSKYNHVVFLHNDIILDTKQWGVKLLKQFNNNPQYGIIGVAGTKSISETGRWWDDKNKMYGRVKHTHEGKSWLSSYSDDLGSELEEVVLVDGVFFAVDKDKIISKFDEDVKGFHFYDVDFCFNNYLNGVKIGVTTIVRVNHMSIGMTNDKWEENRLNFIEKNKLNLPQNIKRILRKNEKLKVLIGCLSFANFTGSELYVFELAKGLIQNNCEVTICSNVGEPLASMGKKIGIKLTSIQEPPNFKLGDGKWLLKTQEGDVTSQPNMLYKIKDEKFDIIHLNHKPITEHLLRLYPEVPTICSIHSEVIPLEEPIISDQIKKYIAIRPEIKEYINDKFGIDEQEIEVIYNPIDSDRFKHYPITKNTKKRTLFVGTIDYLRKNTIQDLINETRLKNEELWIVGKKNDNYLDQMIDGEPHVKHFPQTSKVETFIKQCDETAGILLGRTTIEGWLCGKKGWIYDVDSSGNIISKKLHDIPSDIDKFKSENVINKIIDLYKQIL